MKMVLATFVLAAACASALAADLCRHGPTYWCASIPNAAECGALTHCAQTVWRHQIIDVEESKPCHYTQKLVETIRLTTNKKDGPERASHLVASICSFIKGDQMRRQCKDLVKSHLPEILQLVRSDIDSAVVGVVLGLCKPLEERQDTPPARPLSTGVSCSDCSSFVKSFQELNNPESMRNLVDIITNDVCSSLGNVEQVCKRVLETLVPKLLKFIEESKDAERLCQLGPLCRGPGFQKPKLAYLAAVVRAHVADDVKGVQTVMEDRVSCYECDKLFSSALAFTKDSPFRKSVESAVGHLCSVTTIGEEKCRLLSERFISDEAVSALTRDLTPRDVCAEALSCQGSWPEDTAPLKVSQPVEKAKATDTCAACEQLFSDVLPSLKTEITEQEIVSFSQQYLCSERGQYETQCNLLVGSMVPSLNSLLSDERMSSSACSHMNFCPNNNLHYKFDFLKELGAALNSKSVGGVVECDACSAIVENFRDADRDPGVQRAVVGLLNEVCDKLGDKYPTCKSLVTQYAPQLFELLAGELDPTTVCELLLQCGKPGEDEDEPQVNEVTNVNLQVEALPQPAEPPVRYSAVYNQQSSVVEENVHESLLMEGVPQGYGETTECSLCRYFLEALDKLIAGNKTEANIDNALDTVCGILPSEVTVQCEALVNKTAPAIIDLMLQELDPQVVCDEFNICNNVTEAVDNESTAHFEDQDDHETANAITCELCRSVVGALDKLIAENRTEEAIEKGLEDICNDLPRGIHGQCLAFVQEYSGPVIQMVLQELDPVTICLNLKLCEKAPQDEVTPRVEAGPLCQVCELVVSRLDAVIGENKTEIAFEEALEKVCDELPASIKSQCESLVKTYAPLIVQLMAKELKPDAVCKALGVCTQTAENPPRVEAGPLCQVCELVVGRLDAVIGENKTEIAFEDALEKVCDELPASVKTQCESLVKTYAPLIVQLMVKELKPDAVCKALGVCTQTGGVVEVAPRPLQAGPLCQVCELVVSNLDAVIGENKTEIAFEEALEKVCDELPASIKSQCESLVKTYAPAIVHLLVQELKPEAVCKALGVCTATPRVEIAIPEPTEGRAGVQGSEECAVCKLILQEVNNILGENRTEAAVIAAVEKVCDVVSGDLRLECVSEVENYGPAVLDLLQHVDDPAKVCALLQVCPSLANATPLKKTKKPRDGEVCLICQMLANYAGEALKEEVTTEEVEKLLNDVCTVLPANATVTCKSIVKEYVPMILNLVAEEDDPMRVCQDMKLCPTANLSRKMVVGVNPCSMGPAYWCANVKNARECGMVKECADRYGLEL